MCAGFAMDFLPDAYARKTKTIGDCIEEGDEDEEEEGPVTIRSPVVWHLIMIAQVVWHLTVIAQVVWHLTVIACD